MGHQGDILRGTFFAVAGFTAWAVTDTLVKIAGLSGLSPFLILFLSGFSASFCGIAGLLVTNRLYRLKPVNVKLQLIRSVVLLALSFSALTAFTNLPVTTVYISIFSSPFLMALYGRIFLNESLSKGQIIAIFLGFTGVLIALSNSAEMTVASGENPIAGYIALPSFVFCYIAGMVILRYLGDTETSESTMLFPNIVCAIFFLPSLFFADMSQLSGPVLALVLSIGAMGVSGYWFMIKSFKMVPMAITSTMQYTQLVTGAVLGYLIWDRVPDVQTWAGGAMIIIAGIMMAFFARKGGLRPLPVQEEI